MNKALFGAYLNTAQHNAYMILNHIKDLVNSKEKDVQKRQKGSADVEEARLDNIGVLQLKNEPEKIAYTLKLLYLHFPFLAMLVPQNAANEQNNYQLVATILKEALVRLNNERNRNSHYKDQTLETKSYLQALNLDKLQQEFIAAFTDTKNNAIKRRYPFIAEIAKTKAQAAQASKAAKEPETSIKTEDLFTKFSKPKQNKKENKQESSPQQDSKPQITATQNSQKDDFVLVYLQKYSKKNSFWQGDTLQDRGKEFSEKGLVYFICLFLERKQAHLLLNSVSGFKNTAILEYRGVRDMYAHNCCKLPQPRLESSDILLDMLNELNRCPKVLYETFGDTDKEKFHKAIDNENAITKRNDENGELLEHEKMIRHQNRFPYFALRYFDDTDAFPKLRFQLYIGKLLQKSYDKELQGEEYQRQITKEIHTFGKVSDFLDKNINKLHKTWQDKIFTPEFTTDEYGFQQVKNTPQVGDIVQFSPQYNFGTNKIAIKIGSESNKPIRKKKNQKGVELDFIENEKPTAILSTHELPNVFLYHYLQKQGFIGLEIEKLVVLQIMGLFADTFLDTTNCNCI